jgi:hypothetical protein
MGYMKVEKRQLCNANGCRPPHVRIIYLDGMSAASAGG